MPKSFTWKLAPSDGSTTQPRGGMPIEQADPPPESANLPTSSPIPTNIDVPKREAQLGKELPSSPIKIFTAQRNTNSSSPGAAATKVVAASAQRKAEKPRRGPHLKIKKISADIGQPAPDQMRGESEKDSERIMEEVVGIMGKLKIPVVPEKPKNNATGSSKVREEVVDNGKQKEVKWGSTSGLMGDPKGAEFPTNFSFALTWQEIEKDFLLMKAPMKKTPSVENLYPGNRLHEVCAAADIIEEEAAGLLKNQRGK